MAKIQAPSGTRDMYPADLLKRRYIEKLWRDTSIRHGFEEIDGPTFETTDLYAVKSGEGILSEVFQVFSGKDEAEVARIRGGANAPYALRPEFTPTLARMYAAKAGSLPKPTKWFWQQNCFRAEKQQRGRLREFGQWNCDILGGENDPASIARLDADLIAVLADSLSTAGIVPGQVAISVGSRKLVPLALLEAATTTPPNFEAGMAVLDARSKLGSGFESAFRSAGFDASKYDATIHLLAAAKSAPNFEPAVVQHNLERASQASWPDFDLALHELGEIGVNPWITLDISIVRGLAYYTGTVFEAIASGERAIAGGGRYDNLIELFGGPATPAVGFGMGDVVLSLVLQDRGLLPEGDALMDALSRPSASYRPDVFVIPAGQSPEEQEAAAKAVRPLVAKLRRGVESEAYVAREGRKPWDANRYALASNGAPPLHARSSSKATKNIGKLLQDAAGQKAKLAVIVENAEEVTIKDLRTNQQDATRTKIAELGRVVADRLGA